MRPRKEDNDGDFRVSASQHVYNIYFNDVYES